jgi:hypothetical protein
MPWFRRRARPDTAHYVLSGFANAADYEKRTASWESDDAFIDIERAVTAARTWLDGQRFDAQVDVIHVSGHEGTVQRVVSQTGVEEIGDG